MIIGEAKGLKFEDYLFSEVIRTSGRTDNGLVWKPRMNKLKFVSGYIKVFPRQFTKKAGATQAQATLPFRKAS